MTSPNQTEENQAKPISVLKEIWSFIHTLAFIIVGVVLIRVTLIEAYRIPSGSMLPTLKIGDHILVTKLNYSFQLPLFKRPIWEFSTPKRGDIVVFTRADDPATIEDDSEINIIKRVLAIGGDTLEVRGASVLLNGQELKETDYTVWWENGGIIDFGPVTVPKDHVLVMGDNRDHSKDSRFWSDPFLPVEKVKGKALIVYWSWDAFTRIGTLIK